MTLVHPWPSISSQLGEAVHAERTLVLEWASTHTAAWQSRSPGKKKNNIDLSVLQSPSVPLGGSGADGIHEWRGWVVRVECG